ncbi:hypothetical protein DAPK24_045070 [Pichia kluyveri]|uniref:Myb-like domain-containing protein n=1 Tax=Pichia kluyveri TaxID=36015 RepID=A0AAV5R8T9_PICKL|nr:hypothetical protein DAPK24_045070 [Pichia kluyveri]
MTDDIFNYNKQLMNNDITTNGNRLNMNNTNNNTNNNVNDHANNDNGLLYPNVSSYENVQHQIPVGYPINQQSVTENQSHIINPNPNLNPNPITNSISNSISNAIPVTVTNKNTNINTNINTNTITNTNTNSYQYTKLPMVSNYMQNPPIQQTNNIPQRTSSTIPNNNYSYSKNQYSPNIHRPSSAPTGVNYPTYMITPTSDSIISNNHPSLIYNQPIDFNQSINTAPSLPKYIPRKSFTSGNFHSTPAVPTLSKTNGKSITSQSKSKARSISINSSIVPSLHKPISMIDQGTNRKVKLEYNKVSKLTYEISQNMIIPPFKNLKPSSKSLKVEKPKRSKRRSKFSKEQDELIVKLKEENKSWVEIAEIANVDSYLAARNRYQVLIGQQGGGANECGPDEINVLKEIVDDGEIEKMKYLSKEFAKCTGKLCSYKQIRELLRYLFWKDPNKFDVHENYLSELQRLQMERMEEFAIEGEYDDNHNDDSVDNR